MVKVTEGRLKFLVQSSSKCTCPDAPVRIHQLQRRQCLTHLLVMLLMTLFTEPGFVGMVEAAVSLELGYLLPGSSYWLLCKL